MIKVTIPQEKLVELFTELDKLPKKTDEYYAERNKIITFVATEMKEALKAYRIKWERKYRLDPAECKSLMNESIINAVDTYDMSKGKCKFASFLWTVASQIFKNHLSKIYAQKRMPRVPGHKNTFGSIGSVDVSISVPGDSSSENSFTLLDVLEDGKSMEKSADKKLLAKKIYDEATPKQKRVLKRLWSGRDYTDTGKPLGMSPSDICNMVKELRAKYSAEYDATVT